MTNEPQSDHFQNLWQGQSTEDFRMTPEQIRTRIEKLFRKTRRRNRGGYVACALVVLSCVWWLIQFDTALERTGTLLTLVGIGTLIVQLRMNQRGERDAHHRAAMGETDSLAFLRGELERQVAFHRGKQFLVRMLALIPGPLLFCAGFAQAHPEIARNIAVQAIIILALVVAAVPLNRWVARGYQRQLDGLGRMQSDSR
jgi:hypothetical protein